MKFLDYQVQTQDGDVIRVDLSGNEANVRVMDESNFQSYRAGGQHRCFGRHYRKSPAIITPPHSGQWHVVVDLGRAAGRVRAAVRVLQCAMY
jgi:hypothetical protein